MLLCCLSHQCVFICAVSNENQFMCILKHSGIGSWYFILFYLYFSKDQAAQAEALYLQNSVYPASSCAVYNPINSKWSESRACSHAHVFWRWAVCKLPAATLKPLDGFLLLGLAGFFPRWGARAHTMSIPCLLHGYSLPSPFPLACTTLALWACFSSHFSVKLLSPVLSWVHWGDLAWFLINRNY